MKNHSFYLALVATGSLLLTGIAAHAEADGSAQLSFTNLSITAGSSDTVNVTSLQAGASVQSGVNGQNTSGSSAVADASGQFATNHAEATIPVSMVLNFNGLSYASTVIPGQTAGNDSGTGTASIVGQFSISGGVSGSPVNTTILIPNYSGFLVGFTDFAGQTVSVEADLIFKLDGNVIASDDRLFTIGANDVNGQNWDTSLQTSVSLNYDQSYQFEIDATTITSAVNTPEPGTTAILVIGLGLVCFGSKSLRQRISQKI